MPMFLLLLWCLVVLLLLENAVRPTMSWISGNIKVHRRNQQEQPRLCLSLHSTPQPSDNDENKEEPRPPYYGGGSTLLIIGLGRVGKRVAQRAAPYFDTILGTTTTFFTDPWSLAKNLRQVSLSEIVDSKSDRPSGLLPTFNCTHILITIPGTASHLRTRTIPQSFPGISNSSRYDTSAIPDTDNNVPSNNSINMVPAQQFYDSLLEQWMPRNNNNNNSICGWVGVLSTTAVYGNHDGKWVNEESECLVDETLDHNALQWIRYEKDWMTRVVKQTSKTDAATVATAANGGEEEDERHSSLGGCLRIFRCAGIYGSTQSALHTVYRRRQNEDGSFVSPKETTKDDQKTTTTTKPGRTVTNRIHEDDLARAVVASMLQCPKGSDTTIWPSLSLSNKGLVEIYNLADDLPESRQTVLAYAANLLDTLPEDSGMDNQKKRQPSSFNKDEQSSSSFFPTTNENDERKRIPPGARSARRRRDQKRVDNSKMKQHLLNGSTLLYPTYKEGLQSILRHPRTPWKNQPQQNDNQSILR